MNLNKPIAIAPRRICVIDPYFPSFATRKLIAVCNIRSGLNSMADGTIIGHYKTYIRTCSLAVMVKAFLD